MRHRRPDLRPAAQAPALEPTYSLVETREQLGVCEATLHKLLTLGLTNRGLHPLKGGLYPSYKLSHKKRRVPAGAIARHLAHMLRLEIDPAFAAQMRAKVRGQANKEHAAA